MRILLYLSFFITFCTGCSTVEKEQYDVVLKNGFVINLETGNSNKSHIYITQGRIEKIGEIDENHLFNSKLTIDVSGKYIVPGFWDNHVHFRGGKSLIQANKEFLKLFIANGITTVRDAGGDLTTSVLDWRKQIDAGQLVGPSIFTSGPKIDGANGTWAGSLKVTNEADITKALDSLQNIPSDFVKLYDSKIAGDMYLKTIAEAQKRDLITSGHMPFTVTLDEAVDSGIDAIEHLYYVMKGCASNEKEITKQLQKKAIGFWDAMPLLMENYQDSTAARTFFHLKGHNVYVVPTLHIGKTLSYLDEVDHSTDSYLKYMNKGIIKTYEGRINRVKNASKKAIADRKKLDKFFGQLTKTLHNSGVALLAGSDSGAYNSYTYPGISLHKELEEMVANGITPLDALRTSAYNGAKFLKKDADYGLVAEGKIADLLVLDANPLVDIKNTMSIHTVIKQGKPYSKQQLKELLESAIQN